MRSLSFRTLTLKISDMTARRCNFYLRVGLDSIWWLTLSRAFHYPECHGHIEDIRTVFTVMYKHTPDYDDRKHVRSSKITCCY